MQQLGGPVQQSIGTMSMQGNYGMNTHVNSMAQFSNQKSGLYGQVLPTVKSVLEAVLSNEFDESAAAVTTFVLDFQWPDGNSVEWCLQNSTDYVMKGRVLEALAHWIRNQAHQLDLLVSAAQAGNN